MAYGDLGEFLPGEGTYGPGVGREVMAAQARQKGTYLSQMDQFYEELEFREEAQIRQIEAEEEEWRAVLEQGQLQFEATMEMQKEEQEWLQDYYGAQAEFESGLAAATFQEEYPQPYEGINLSLFAGTAAGYQMYGEIQAYEAGLPQAMQYNPMTNQFY